MPQDSKVSYLFFDHPVWQLPDWYSRALITRGSYHLQFLPCLPFDEHYSLLEQVPERITVANRHVRLLPLLQRLLLALMWLLKTFS